MSAMPLRVLFLAPVEPWCRENGSSLIISDMLEALAGRSDVEIVAVFLRQPPLRGCEQASSRCLECVTLGVRGLPRWRSVAAALVLGTSPLRTRFANKQVARAVLTALHRRGFMPSLVHAEHLPLVDIARSVAQDLGCPWVYRAHNVESRLWERRLGVGGSLREVAIRRLERAELDAIDSANLTLCISPLDLEWARSHLPEARTEFFPCVLLFRRYERLAAHSKPALGEICFVGGLEWGPNEHGLRWLIDCVVPLIVKRVPDARIAVLARGASDRPWLTDNPHVRLLPAEMSAPSVFAQSRASLAPLFQGGGVRVKILESLAVGCPVVATPIGSEGLELPGIRVSDAPNDFANACIAYLQDSREDSRVALHRHARRLHDAEEWAGTLAEYWRNLAASPHPRPARL